MSANPVMAADPRLQAPRWDAGHDTTTARRRRLLTAVGLVFAVWYFAWLLQPARVGSPALYVLLVMAELFNLGQAVGFWWTVWDEGRRRDAQTSPHVVPDVDVLIPTYDEPLEVVEPTVAAAAALRGARVHVYLLDDGGRPSMESLAARHGAVCVQRPRHDGAKAGNINHALQLTTSPFVAVFDCDHVPDQRFLEATLGAFTDERVAFVQTPQYYANADLNAVAEAAWAQQALFFGAIARGKDSRDAMFCCGTNVVFRRRALEDVGGFPQDSLTEDFELSVRMHERGWRSRYVAQVLASGLGPEDIGAYLGQQQRWARGCVSALGAVVRARMPLRLRLQYVLSSMFFLTGWTAAVYMSLPVIRIVTGAQPLADATADQFLLHFVPYFVASLGCVAAVGGGSYTFSAFALTFASFWVHVGASLAALLHRPGRFVVTRKQASSGRQVRAVLPTLVAIAVLAAAAGFGLLRDRSPATLNNVAFAAMHVAVLLVGVWPAIRGTTAVTLLAMTTQRERGGMTGDRDADSA
jgi:cellulose synthase (UDP-forming)